MARYLSPGNICCFVLLFWSVLSAEMTVFSLLYVIYILFIIIILLFIFYIFKFFIYFLFLMYILKCFPLLARGRLMCNKPRLYCFLYGSLDLRTIVCLTATKFKSFVFSVLCLTVSYAENIFVILILNDFCLFPANFCYEII